MISKINGACDKEDQQFLADFSDKYKFNATLLPIKSVGVQGDCRSYSYVVALSEDAAADEDEATTTDKFERLARLAKLIPRICHNVNRVCYVFGESVKHPVTNVTTTTLTPHVIDQLREADHIATSLLYSHNFGRKVSQMPIILIPIHFDREAITRQQSCQRSVVIRTFITEDFMTGQYFGVPVPPTSLTPVVPRLGVPAIPNKQIPFKVRPLPLST